MQKAINFITEINELLNLSFSSLQGWNLLKDWKVGDSKEIKGTRNVKLIQTDNHIRFLTEIPPGTSFDIHWHDCKEDVTVVSGILADKFKKGKVFKMGDICKWDKYTKHQPFNPDPKIPLFLIVDFYL